MNDNVFDIKGFYPTPDSIINKMLYGIDFKLINSILEPSAGNGRIVERVKDKLKYAHLYGYNKEAKWDIDTIEINENLQHILKGKGYRIVHDNFLTFDTYKKYDLIILNPPFEAGDKHLLKAIEMQEQGGKIVCLLNAETLRNPYSNTRKDLLRKLEDYNAEIEYIENGFFDAERKTDVEVALIKINIEKTEHDSIILNELKRQENFKQQTEQSNYIVDSDYIKRIVAQYNFEVKAGLKLIDEYEALKPFMLNSFKDNDYNIKSVLSLVITDRDKYEKYNLRNAYIEEIRMKYWQALFMSDEFMGLFTSNLRQKYYDQVKELKNYDFSLFNIYEIRIQLNKEMVKGIEDTIIALFDQLSYQSSWDNEFSKNIHYYNGWKTNSCWKVNKKVIIRLNAFNDWVSNHFRPTDYRVVDKLSDIEKSLNYLQTGTDIEVEEIDLKTALNFAEQYGDTKKIKTKYFMIDMYKKGTAHLTFNSEELLHRFNIYGSQSKNWLPPSYGKKTYNEMTEEEKVVIRDFEGELSYSRVMNNTDRYILETSQLLMLA